MPINSTATGRDGNHPDSSGADDRVAVHRAERPVAQGHHAETDADQRNGHPDAEGEDQQAAEREPVELNRAEQHDDRRRRRHEAAGQPEHGQRLPADLAGEVHLVEVELVGVREDPVAVPSRTVVVVVVRMIVVAVRA